jgi:hypothetical protein
MKMSAGVMPRASMGAPTDDDHLFQLMATTLSN